MPHCQGRNARLGLFALVLLTLAASDAHGQSVELRLATPPHAPEGAPDAIAHVPAHFDAERPLELVIFLHGFSGCARALVASEPTPCSPAGPAQRGYGLARTHDSARTNSVLIVPQLAFLARDARAPRFERAGGFDALLAELRAGLASRVDPAVPVASITLVAHSAGYRAAAAILRDPSLRAPIRNVVLLDALYAHWDVFATWLRSDAGHRLVSLYTHAADTTLGNRKLAALLGTSLPSEGKRSPRRARTPRSATAEPAAARTRLRLERVATPHRLLPEVHLAALLQELSSAPGAAPGAATAKP